MTENNDSPITITDDYYNYLYWKELFEGAKEDLDSTRKELEELRGKMTVLINGFRDCVSYIDVDNLTMQTKEKEWRTIIRAAVEKGEG